MITKEADSIIGYVEVKIKNEAIKRILLIQMILIRSKLSWLSILLTLWIVTWRRLKGIWNKTVKTKNLLLLQEHQMKFNLYHIG
jgi:hypothetical protein